MKKLFHHGALDAHKQPAGFQALLKAESAPKDSGVLLKFPRDPLLNFQASKGTSTKTLKKIPFGTRYIYLYNVPRFLLNHSLLITCHFAWTHRLVNGCGLPTGDQQSSICYRNLPLKCHACAAHRRKEIAMRVRQQKPDREQCSSQVLSLHPKMGFKSLQTMISSKENFDQAGLFFFKTKSHTLRPKVAKAGKGSC